MEAFNGDKHLAERFIELRDKHNIELVIETGTYHGQTTEWLGKNFPKVITIESNKEYYEKAKERLKRYDNVFMVMGDSSRVLEDFIPKKKNVLFFLDAHWYQNPVIQELKQIKDSGTKPIIAIHDFKVPDRLDLGYDIYPEQGIVYDFEWIKPLLDSIYEHYEISYNNNAVGAKRGCIFIEPK